MRWRGDEMGLITQCLVVSRLTLSGLRQRFGSAFVIFIGMTCVTGVLVSMLSVTAGFMRVLRASGDPQVAIVLSADALSEQGADLDAGAVGTILDAPGVARGPDGHPFADAEVLINAPPADGFVQGSLAIRGIGQQGFSLRPGLKIVAGRMFGSGRQELIVGAAAQRGYHFKVGDTVIMPDGEWPIVGVFEGGGALESELMADAATLMASTRRAAFGSVIVKLTTPAAFDEFRQWLASRPALRVKAQRLGDYYLSRGDQFTFYQAMAWIVGAIMSIGALFGSVNILYSAVRARTRELGTLCALGYEPLPLAFSVIVESVFLSLAGAAAGCLIAWALFDGHETASGVVFRWDVSIPIVALGVVWAIGLALLGSVPPAIRVARQSVVEVLRE